MSGSCKVCFVPASSYSSLWALREALPVPGTSGLLLPTPGLILLVLGLIPSEFCSSSEPEIELVPRSWR